MAQDKDKSSRRLILSLAMKYRFDKAHALKVESAALKLFDCLKKTTGMNGRERVLLSHACLLHDIGNYLNEIKHHKHSKYIVETDECLSQYDIKDRQLLSLLVFNHRKKLHKNTLLLPGPDRDMVLKLSALLRVADSLDFNRDKFLIKEILLSGNTVIIALNRPLPEKSKSKLIQKKTLFCDVFGMDICIVE